MQIKIYSIIAMTAVALYAGYSAAYTPMRPYSVPSYQPLTNPAVRPVPLYKAPTYKTPSVDPAPVPLTGVAPVVPGYLFWSSTKTCEEQHGKEYCKSSIIDR